MNIILLGPPGAGKGTQALLLCKKFSIKHISTGEILRQAIQNSTDLGLQAKQIIEQGNLVNDELIINLVISTIAKPEYNSGILFDGFPRNLLQAKSLKQMKINIDAVIYFDLTDEIIIDRLVGRRYHLNSGRVYHIKYNPPKQPNIDDITGEPLIIRKDDQEEVIRQRLYVYYQTTKPLIEWYQNEFHEKFIKIDASNKQSEIFSNICEFFTQKSLV